VMRPKNRTTEPPVMQQRGSSFFFLRTCKEAIRFKFMVPLQAKSAGIEQRHLKEGVLSERRAFPGSWGPAKVFLGPVRREAPPPHPLHETLALEVLGPEKTKRWRKRPSAPVERRASRRTRKLTGRVKRGEALQIRPRSGLPLSLSLSPWSDLLSEAGECESPEEAEEGVFSLCPFLGSGGEGKLQASKFRSRHCTVGYAK
jgi:hypothetical protein